MIKIAILTTAAIIGIGSAAGAATVTTEQYNFRLQYNGPSYEDVSIVSNEDNSENGFNLNEIKIGDKDYGIKPFFFSNLQVGDFVDFRAEVRYLDPPILQSPSEGNGYYSNGGTAVNCTIGNFDCSKINSTFKENNNNVNLDYDDEIFIRFKPEIGSSFSYGEWFISGRSGNTDENFHFTLDREFANFTVASELAPVPLPASAVLLPIGLGAFGMMRKRRRKAA